MGYKVVNFSESLKGKSPIGINFPNKGIILKKNFKEFYVDLKLKGILSPVFKLDLTQGHLRGWEIFKNLKLNGFCMNFW